VSERNTPGVGAVLAHRLAFHRRFLADWLVNDAMGCGRSLEEIWRIREQCVAALGEAG
jgi:hypothetical protein